MNRLLSMGALLAALVGVRAAIVSRAGRPPFVNRKPGWPHPVGRPVIDVARPVVAVAQEG
jgi:hypothetical protein